MPKLIQMPDGSVAEFPDNMTDAQIESVLAGRSAEWGGGRQFLQGLTFGFGDEIEAGIGSMLPGGLPYDQAHAALGVARNTYETQNPGAAIAYELAGAIPTAVIPALGAARTAQIAARVGPNALRYGGAAASGAATGALTGAGKAEPGQRMEGAIKEGAIGAAVSPAMSAVGQGAKAGARMVGDIGGNLPGVGRATDWEKRALTKYLQAMQRDGTNPDELAQKLRDTVARYGLKPETPQEYGENVRKLADTAAGYPGKSAKRSVELAAERSADQSARLTTDLTEAFGVQGDPYEVAQRLSGQRLAAAKPLYDKAYAEAGAIADPQIGALMSRPAFRSAYNRARMYAGNEGVELPADPSQVAQWDLRTLDFVKKGLDGELFEVRRPGAGKSVDKELERQVLGLRAQYVDLLDSYSPTYKKARSAWAGPSQLLEALEEGKNFSKLDPRELQRKLASLTEAEREQYAIGALDAIRTKMFSLKDRRDAVYEVFGSKQSRQQIAQLVGPERFAKLEAQMQREARIRLSDQKRLGNSVTASRLAGQADLEADPNIVTDVMQQGPLRGALNYVIRSGGGVAQPTADRLADTLYTTDISRQFADLRRLQLLDEELRRRALGGGVATGAIGGQGYGLLDK